MLQDAMPGPRRSGPSSASSTLGRHLAPKFKRRWKNATRAGTTLARGCLRTEMPVPRKYCEVRCMKRSKAQNKRRREGIPAKRAGGGGSKKGNAGPHKKRDGKGSGSGAAGAVLGGRVQKLT